MANVTKKMVQLFNLMKSGKDVQFEKIVQTLDCKPVSAMVVICQLRRDVGAEIETIREGRKVLAYRLENADQISDAVVLTAKAAKPNKSAKPKAAKPPKAAKKVAVSSSTKKVTKKVKAPKAAPVVADDGSVPVLDSNLEISEISEREFDDIKSQLGLA